MNRKPLFFAMIVSLIISWALYNNVIQKGQAGLKPDTGPIVREPITVPMVTVVAAKVRIPAKTKLNPTFITNAVELKEINASAAPTDVFTSVASLADKFTSITILPGDIFTKERLLDKNTVPNLSFAIPAGRRAYSVTVDNIKGVSGFIQQGDLVDIVAFFRPPAPEEAKSRVVLQDLPVLAVGKSFDFDTNTASNTPSIAATKFEVVTLAVTPNEVEALSYLVNSGKPFQMVLKNPLEIGKDVVTIGTTEKMVMDAILKGGFSKDDKSARGPAEVSIPPVEPIVTVKVENQTVT